jgi:flagellar biosynthesis/type III secretory pathway chaperone
MQRFNVNAGIPMNTAPHDSMRSPAPVKTAAEADALVTQVIGVIADLSDVLQQETEHLRAGRVSAASAVAEPKHDLSRRYVAGTLRLKAARPQLAQVAPARRAALQERHAALRALLQTNLTVLATAHAVSEGIVRGVSKEITRRSVPHTYGASGRTNVPSRTAAAPIAVSRSL